MLNIITPTSTTISSQLEKVNDIRLSSQQTLQQVFNRWRGNLLRIWQDPNPQAIFDAWQTAYPGEPGKYAVASNQTIAFLELMQPGCTTSIVSIVKPFTIDPTTGAITITP